MERAYWDRFYAQPHPDIANPSTFARECMKGLGRGDRLFELGCGNGRDAVFFAKQGLRVLACDQSDVAIQQLERYFAELELPHPPQLVCGDFTRLGDEHADALDVVYSRFTLHAVTAEEASSALAWSFKSLVPGGKIFIEARSVKGSLYGLGEPRGRDAFVYNGHYRRFIRGEELVEELGSLGFRIAECVEGTGLAVHGDDDPVVVRVTGSKL